MIIIFHSGVVIDNIIIDAIIYSLLIAATILVTETEEIVFGFSIMNVVRRLHATLGSVQKELQHVNQDS